MKIAIIYPPLTFHNDYPLLTQNRQFKYTNSLEVRIYPVVMAYLATMLKKTGHRVLYLDGINLRMDKAIFNRQLVEFSPDFIVMETKAPILKSHAQYIKLIKKNMSRTKVILVGDHVTFFPEESLKISQADMAIQGGDYDFIINELINVRGEKKWPGGIYYTKSGRIKNTGPSRFYDLNQLPLIDRELTMWKIYGEAYLYHPCAYIMSGRGCGGSNSYKNFKSNKKLKGQYDTKMPGLCTFCIWQHSFWRCSARLQSPEKVADEIENLYRNYHVKEIFDDNESGAIWNEKWLNDFHREMKKRNLTGKVSLSSNARADSLTDPVCRLLKASGFRLLKIGIESGNDKTLNMLKKDETTSETMNGVKKAKEYGLIAMLTTMVGYPWETENDALQTYNFTKEIMLYKTHFGDSLQSSIVVPYPGTPLYRQALKNKWFIVDPEKYENFDMAHQILKTSINTVKWCKKMWRIHLHPLFIIKSIFTLRKWKDIKLAFRGFISLLGHLRDYSA
ncbi:MAG: radical SAM protein [Spirochaetes bacterium]|nr:radical SAM protein [Spirochaetota bacterium]